MMEHSFAELRPLCCLLIAIGCNRARRPAQPPAPPVSQEKESSDVASTSRDPLASGLTHELLVARGGAVLAWGKNYAGQLGTGDTIEHSEPTKVPGLRGVISVAAGDSHSIALTSGGAVYTWGANRCGQLGTGNITQRNTPTRVSELVDVVAVAAGARHSLAAKADGTVWFWGVDDLHRSMKPKRVVGLRNIVAVAAGKKFSLALERSGAVWAWGDNYQGQLGTGDGASRATPVRVSGLPPVRSIAASEGHAAGLTPDGMVWVWGKTWNHRLALARDGTVWAWGGNVEQQLGGAGTTSGSEPELGPVRVREISGATAIAAGGGTSFAQLKSGALMWWGSGRATPSRLSPSSTTPAAPSAPIHPGNGATLWTGEADLDGDGRSEKIVLRASSSQILTIDSDAIDCEGCVAEMTVGAAKRQLPLLSRQVPGGEPLYVKLIDIDPADRRRELVIGQPRATTHDERPVIFRIVAFDGKDVRLHELESAFNGGELRVVAPGRFVTEYRSCRAVDRFYYELRGTQIRQIRKARAATGRTDCSD